MKDFFNYTDKVCIVTGSASGMGLATTKMLVDYCDTTLKKLGLKKERTNISATNPLILYMAKKAMQKG